MKSRNIVRLFFSTLIIGALVTLITSFFVKANTYIEFLNPFDLFELFGLLVFFSALGLVFSLLSQMGFFAYLTVNQFGLSMFRGFWPTIQGLLIAFTLFDLVYFRYKNSEEGSSLYVYIAVALAILIYGWIVSSIKAKETNRRAFVPALFFMVVVTSIEWVPGLRSSGSDYTWLMIIPLLVCNTYQLLMLHRLTTEKPKTENLSN